jgi:hypothetical protein
VATDAIDLEAAGIRFGDPVLDHVEIAIEEVDSFAIDLQPGATVDDAAPRSGFSDVTGVAKLADGIGVDAATVIESDIPVAIRSRHATSTGPAEGHRFHPRYSRDVFDERGDAHGNPPTTTGTGWDDFRWF